MSLFGKPKSYLGIDLGSGGVKLVELSIQKHRPVLFTYGLTSDIQDVHQFITSDEPALEEASMLRPGSAMEASDLNKKKATVSIDDVKIKRYAAIIKAVCKEAKTVSKNAVVSLPVSAVFHAIVTLPAMKKEEFDSVLKAEIRKLLPYKFEDTALDYQVLPALAEAKTRRVLVNAVPRALVAAYTKIFQLAGLKLDSLEPESMALARALVGRDQAVTMLVDVGAERTNFFIIDQSVPITHNSIEIGGQKINAILKHRLGLTDATVEQAKRDMFSKLLTGTGGAALSRDEFVKMFLNVIDPIAKEIEFSFDLYLRQTGNEGKRPEKIILTGGAAQFPFLADYLSDKFKIKCYLGDPWGRVIYQDSLKPVISSIGSRMAVAIGLALRNVV